MYLESRQSDSFRGAAIVGLISHVTLLGQRGRQLSWGLRGHAQELSLLWLCYPQGLPTSASSWRKGKAWEPRRHTSFLSLSTVWGSITWPHLITKEAGKYAIDVHPEGEDKGFW